jgi:phage host-nuclease inhibitor protein Gam
MDLNGIVECAFMSEMQLHNFVKTKNVVSKHEVLKQHFKII